MAERDIRLKTRLELPNETKTRNLQEELVKSSSLVFAHDPRAIVELRERVQALARQVAKAKSFESIDPVVRGEWKLTAENFAIAKKMIGGPGDVEAFSDKLERALENIEQWGILDATAVPPDQERETNRIEVYTVGEERPRFLPIESVLLSELVRPEGSLFGAIRREWPNVTEAKALFQLLAPQLRGTLTFDAVRTRRAELAARAQAEPVRDSYAAGYLVVPAGEPITEERMRLLEQEHRTLEKEDPVSARTKHLAGLAVLVISLMSGLGAFFRLQQPTILDRLPRLAVLCGAWIVTIGLARLLGSGPYHAEILPVAVACLLLAIALDRWFALALAFAFSVLLALVSPEPMENFLVMLGGTTVGVLVLDHVRTRTKLIVVGLQMGLAYAILSVAIGAWFDEPWLLIAEDAAWRFGSGLVAGFFISGSLPFIESLFSIVTEISLLELADSSHPLLQELVRRAPGTHQHSVAVSHIAEAAAQRIDANALLVRVGALFHDIGKMLKPHYFIENQTAEDRNRHDQLAPALSTLIIIGHVKDGMDLAQQHHLPRPIIDMIEQHHGTTLVDYFFHEATRDQQGTPDPEEGVEESAFRYPGPKPQSKEAAVLMLADCVEGASRTMSEPTPASIEKLVHNLALNRLLDGQFDESGLTLKELAEIEESLVKSLTSIYHGRIRYPAAV